MVTIQKPIYGGAFATATGASFPFVLPGEQVIQDGESTQIVEPSAHRTEPRCIHFGACGGCSYQHASYTEQIRLKSQILQDIFASAGLKNLPAPQSHHGPQWGYRNRIRLRIVDGRAGYSRRASNGFLPVRMCPIAAPLLWRAAETIMSSPAAARWLAAASELELFCTPKESKLQLTFFLHDPESVRQHPLATLCEALQADLPELASAGAILNPELNRRTRRKANWPGEAWGAEGVLYPAAGRSYWVPRGAFFQVNRFLIDRLVALVCAGESGDLAWDLFAGVGLFTRELAQHFTEVVAVEGSDVAAAALAAAGKPSKDSPGFKAIHSATLDFLRTVQLQRDRPELVVLDPPRAGLGTEGAEILARIAPRRIVYVSCDPTTLARDLAILSQTYATAAIHWIDLFPQTFHMETVVRLNSR